MLPNSVMSDQDDFLLRDRREAGHHWQDNEFCDNLAPLVGALGTAVYMYMTRHAHVANVTVSTRTLADVCHASRATVWRAIQVLEHLRVIRAARGGQGKLPEYELASIKGLMINLGATFNQKRCSWLLPEETLQKLRAEVDGLREVFRAKTPTKSPTVSPESQSPPPQLFHQRASTVSPETPTVSPESQPIYTRLQDYKTKTTPQPPASGGRVVLDPDARAAKIASLQSRLKTAIRGSEEYFAVAFELQQLRREEPKPQARDGDRADVLTLPPADAPLDALVAWVMATCGFSEEGRRRPVLAPALRGVIAQAELGTRPGRVVEMAAAWRNYTQGPTRWGPAKFYLEGHWLHPASWPVDPSARIRLEASVGGRMAARA